MLTASGRIEEKDKRFITDVSEASLTNILFVRLVAKDRAFHKVDFSYSIFDACYLRSCKFTLCKFTGCRFIGSNLHDSDFSGCDFRYAIFERTNISDTILETNAPGFENLQLRFARTLRTNYQQLGDASAVNRAIKLELAATQVHLLKAWKSNDAYYRHKFQGLNRVRAFLNWLQFRALDEVWGNGESAWKLFRSVALVLVLIATIDVITARNVWNVKDYFEAAWTAPQMLLGVMAPKDAPAYAAMLVFIRLVAMALFLSVIIKRFSRR